MRHSRRTQSGTISLNQLVEDVGIVANTAKIVALPPKGQAPTAEEILLLERVDVRIVREGGVTVVGVPIGTYEYVLEPALEVVRDRGADRLAHSLAEMPNKQAAGLIAIEPLGQRTSYIDRALDAGLSLEACRKGRQRGAAGVRKNPRATRRRRRAQPFSHEVCPGNQL